MRRVCRGLRQEGGILDHLVEGAPQLAEIYGFQVAPEETGTTLADYFASELKHPPKQGEVLQLGPIALVAYRVADERVTSVGLRLPEEERRLLCRLLGRLPSRTHPHAPPTGVREAPMHEIAGVGH